MSALATISPLPALPRVLLVDDHQVLLDGLAKLLQGYFLVSTVRNTSGQIPERTLLSCDIAIVGINTADNFSAAQRIRTVHRDLPIVLLLAFDNLVSLEAVNRLGAKAVLAKHISAETLISTVAGVLETTAANTQVSSRRRLLTSRQIEVLRLIALGYSSKEIANSLKCSPRTAEFHRANIMDRLSLRSTAQLTRYAISAGLPLDP